MHPTFIILASLAALPEVLAQPSPSPTPVSPAFPPSCQTACADTQSIIAQCTSQRINNDINAGLRGDWKEWDDFDDTAYASCLCNASNASTDFPACRACLRDLPGDDHGSRPLERPHRSLQLCIRHLPIRYHSNAQRHPQ
ncbi:hypothetical protein EJ03DRAFT_27012 [Teratosphaeria nubilosa]|uniref:Uncharacterized protein n=1 Tax=Teratosphaeria nubilosa TaxID=161662 RepID=A0A6G1KWH1_9PEZI|nr:hypothetical protein EJ03DRAFT_27012 [Teratosphaeria nubilosa]